jgi:predicted dienelactone hydrolase
MIWYPAAAEAREEAQWIGPPILPFYSAGSAARDAPHAAGPTQRPLILLSHGFGGTASDLAWLGTALAAHGFIVVAVNHPGNNALEAYTVEGYSLMWLRAVDLGEAIDAVLNDKTFGSRIDPAYRRRRPFARRLHRRRGGRGITDPARIQAFCRSSADDQLCVPPPNISEMWQKSLARLSSDPDFRQRYSAAGNSYRDARLRAVFAMAPGLGPVFTPDSLGKVSIPVAIVSGSADEITPPSSGAESLAKAIPHATLKFFPHGATLFSLAPVPWWDVYSSERNAVIRTVPTAMLSMPKQLD